MLDGPFVPWVEPTPRSEPFVSLGYIFLCPATGPAVFPRRSTLLTPLAEAGRRRVLAPRFAPLPPRLLPRRAPGTRCGACRRGSTVAFRGKQDFRIPQFMRKCMT